MKHMLALGLGILFLQGRTPPASHPRMGGDRGQIQLQDYTNGKGVRLRYSITAERAGAQPTWDPEKAPPPLELAKAVETARKTILSRKPKFDNVRIWSLQMSRLGDPRFKDRWYYAIEFEPVIDGEELFGSAARELVLMDGTIVEPVTMDGHGPSHALAPQAGPESRPSGVIPASLPSSSGPSPSN